MKPFHIALLLACKVCLGDELVRHPADLRLGDQYRLAFVTSTNRDATLKRAEEYNAYVQSVANAAPVGDWGLSWNVIGETRDVSARENSDTDSYVETGVPIYRLDGERVWDDYVQIWGTEDSEGPIARPYVALTITELGTELEQNPGNFNGPFVWSGTNEIGSQGFQFLGHSVVTQGSPHQLGAFFTGDADHSVSEAHFYAISEVLTAGLAGDLNKDGTRSSVDIDMLSEAVVGMSTSRRFDLNGDSSVDTHDRTAWVEEIANTNFGDADLNGDVSFRDFLALANNFDQPSGWAEGDFDGNGLTDFQDFLVLAHNFGAHPTQQVSAVPEPSSFVLCLGVLGLSRMRRGRN